MPNLTDIIISCFLLFFLLDGWRKSFLKSAIGPFIFAFCTVLGVIYFDLTQNTIKAILITSVSSMVLTIIALISLALSKRSVDPTYQDYSPILSRMMGGVVNGAWQGMILFIIIFLVAVAPLKVYGFTRIQDNIQQSLSYSFIKNSLAKIPCLQRVTTAFSVFQDSNAVQKLSSTDEFQQFFLNKKVQALLEDESFMQNVQKKDYSKIIADPKLLEIFDDDALMNSFNRLAKKIYFLNLPVNGTSSAPIP